ncbi:ArsR/SmtB family transcription factor [Tessaracoccus sp. G1721]
MTRFLPTIECVPANLGHLMPADEALGLTELMKALADPVRLRLLRFVADSPDTTACACHLPPALGISQPTLSHHLKKLVEAGLLIREQRGRWVHYRTQPEAIAPLNDFLKAFSRPPGIANVRSSPSDPSDGTRDVLPVIL